MNKPLLYPLSFFAGEGYSILFYSMRFILLFCFCLPFSLLAQKEDYVWCFGDSLGLDFNRLAQVKLIKSSVSMEDILYPEISMEACASVSDKNGQLLFYLDALDTKISRQDYHGYGCLRDKNHQKIESSDSIKVDYSSTNGAMILPIDDTYYLITHSYLNKTTALTGLFLTTLKHNTTSSEITVKSKNEEIRKGWIAEKISAVKHGNGKDWWILAHNAIFPSDTFFIYHLTKDKLYLHSIQKIGSNYSITNDKGSLVWGEMSVSSDGTKLLSVTGFGVIDIFNFDRCAGHLFNWKNINYNPLPFIYDISYYGCSFSKDGSKIYVSSSDSLLQFNLKAPDIKKSKTLIALASTFERTFGQHQIGPDGKIYIAMPRIKGDQDNIGIIHAPDESNTACYFDPIGMTINSKTYKLNLGLPNMPNYRLQSLVTAYTGIEKTIYICEGDSGNLGYGFSEPNMVYEWTPTYGLNDPMVSSPKASPSQTTTYTLTVRPNPNNPPDCIFRNVHSDTVRVEVIPIPKKGIRTPSSNLLSKDEILYLEVQDDNFHYRWNTGDTTQKIYINKAGLYTVTISNAIGCFITDSVLIKEIPALSFPNAFTPNNDGINDTWDINLIGYHLKNIVIFDRWGVLVYSGNTLPITWNPKVEGVYFYHLEIEGQKEILQKSGNITVIK